MAGVDLQLCAQYALFAMLGVLGFLALFLCVVALLARSYGAICRKYGRNTRRERTFAFFHPYCNSGGGGERVLWLMVRLLMTMRMDEPLRIVIFTGDLDAKPEAILRKAQEHFNLPPFPKTVEFVYLRQRKWVEAARYPVLTMLGQSLGSMLLALEAMIRFPPDIFFDSTGYAFTFIVAYFFGCRVGAYIHYPTISTDMLALVWERRPTYNNSGAVARSTLASYVKVLYYNMFAIAYGIAGRFADVAIVNSSWTYEHIVRLWKVPNRTRIVYPPCDISLSSLPMGQREPLVISVGQFRPEKDHMLQLRAFKIFLDRYLSRNGQQAGGTRHSSPRLVLIGGCRNSEDLNRVEELRGASQALQLSDYAQLKTNISGEQLRSYLGRALVGIHTMWNEHFGIGVVEIMAAGAIALAHNSGGPRADIVVDHGGCTGFLASSDEEYAACLSRIFDAHDRGDQLLPMRERARNRVQTFSDESFVAKCGGILAQELISLVKL